MYKKNLGRLQKENYRPVSLLPHISKVLKRAIYKQINNFMENKISKLSRLSGNCMAHNIL